MVKIEVNDNTGDKTHVRVKADDFSVHNLIGLLDGVVSLVEATQEDWDTSKLLKKVTKARDEFVEMVTCEDTGLNKKDRNMLMDALDKAFKNEKLS